MGCIPSNPLKAATDFVGLTDYAGQDAAQEAQAQAQASSDLAADRSYALTIEELEFQREQYADWKNVYGDLQEDLGTYYKNLNGDNITSQQLTAIQRESQLAQKQVDAQLAQRGLTGSGLEAQALMQNQFGTAQQKANVRANADQVAAQQQMGFLGLGLGQGTNMLGIQAGVSNTGASSQGSQASSFLGSSVGFGNTSQAYSATNIASNQQTISNIMEGVGMAMGASDRKLKENITLVGTIKGINFYTWSWNEVGNSYGYFGTSFGVIAQEIPKDFTIDNTEYLMVDYKKVLDYIGDN